MEETNKDIKILGGNIELSGFKVIDKSSMVIVKKMIGTYARKIEEHGDKIGEIKLTLKPVHEKEKSEKYELHALIIDNGKRYSAETTERNLFVAIDDVLKKILKGMSKNE